MLKSSSKNSKPGLSSSHSDKQQVARPTPLKSSKRNGGSKIAIVCRVLPSINIAESAEINTTQSSLKSKHLKDIIKNPNELCMFSAMEESGNYVIASQEPVKTRLIETYFKRDKDLENLRESFLGNVETFEFDTVLNFLARSVVEYK